MTDLKPCPFCGGEAEMDTWRQYRALVSGNLGCACAVHCLTCEADMSICLEDVTGWTIEEAASHVADRWNTRANDPASFEAGEKAMRARAARKAEKVGNFRDFTREELTPDYGIPRFDMLIEIIDAIRALPTGEQNAED